VSASTNLPPGWYETNFGSVVNTVPINDKKLPKSSYSEAGRYPVVDQGQEFIGGYSDDSNRVVSEGLPVLVFGDHTRVFKYLNEPFIPGADGIKVLKPIGVEAKWLYHIAHALEFPDKGYARHFQHLKAATLCVPPIDEQTVIVAEIEKQFTRLDAGVAALKRVQANLKRYRAAVLKAACEGKLVATEHSRSGVPPLEPGATTESKRQHPQTASSGNVSHREDSDHPHDPDSSAPQKRGDAASTFEHASVLLERILAERRKNWSGRGKYKEPAPPDTTGLPELPDRWVWASLEQLLLNVTDGDHQPPPQVETGVPFLVIGNVRSGQIDFSDTRFVAREYADSVDFFRKPANGDILYTLVGSFGIAVSVTTDEEFCIQRHIGVLRPHALSPTRYLVHILNSPFIFQQATNMATGTAQKTVPLAGLRRLAVPLPPNCEQIRIVSELERRMSVLDELKMVVSANLQRALRLRQAILTRTFVK